MQVSPRDGWQALGMSGASTILECWKQKVRRKNLFFLIFWAYILKGEALDICWGDLSSPGVIWEGRWERKGGSGRGVDRRWTGERGGMKE